MKDIDVKPLELHIEFKEDRNFFNIRPKTHRQRLFNEDVNSH
jgi:predicted transport protein